MTQKVKTASPARNGFFICSVIDLRSVCQRNRKIPACVPQKVKNPQVDILPKSLLNVG